MFGNLESICYLLVGKFKLRSACIGTHSKSASHWNLSVYKCPRLKGTCRAQDKIHFSLIVEKKGKEACVGGNDNIYSTQANGEEKY